MCPPFLQMAWNARAHMSFAPAGRVFIYIIEGSWDQTISGVVQPEGRLLQDFADVSPNRLLCWVGNLCPSLPNFSELSIAQNGGRAWQCDVKWGMSES